MGGHRASAAVRDLNPGYFALVMATGIVSIGVRNHGLAALSAALLWLAAAEYAILVGLTLWRAAAFSSAMRRDFLDPARGFGFFTFVAGTDVLGTRLALAGHHSAALGLLIAGWAGWVALGYVVPWTALLGRAQRPLVASANGTWFVWVVASQSLAVLAATLEPEARDGQSALALLAVFSWSLGVFLYAAVGIFVTARMLAYPIRPADLTPPYWVAMGATAITVVAGARIVQMADAPAVSATRGVVAGASVAFWVFGTWLIPVLVAAGIWRHVVHRVRLTYDPTLWSVVFPLGMYGVAGRFLGDADDLHIIRAIGDGELWAALAAWALVFAAMLAHLARTLVLAPRGQPANAPRMAE